MSSPTDNFNIDDELQSARIKREAIIEKLTPFVEKYPNAEVVSSCAIVENDVFVMEPFGYMPDDGGFIVCHDSLLSTVRHIVDRIRKTEDE